MGHQRHVHLVEDNLVVLVRGQVDCGPLLHANSSRLVFILVHGKLHRVIGVSWHDLIVAGFSICVHTHQQIRVVRVPVDFELATDAPSCVNLASGWIILLVEG
jgi:hypothetical protein